MKLLAAAPFLLLVLAGCSRMGGAAGFYKPIQVGRESENPPPLVEGQDLEIRGDGTFLIRAFPKMEGRVEREGDVLVLKIEKAGGRPLTEFKGAEGKVPEVPPLRLVSADGGARLRPHASNKNPVKFTWVRTPR